jgi:hypothetical protein
MAENPNVGPQPKTPAGQPYGPGPLMIFGLGMLALAVWCFYDLFLGGSGEAWESQGSVGTIWFNRIGMAAGAVGSIYLFILAAKRSKTAAPPPAQP